MILPRHGELDGVTPALRHTPAAIILHWGRLLSLLTGTACARHDEGLSHFRSAAKMTFTSIKTDEKLDGRR